MYHIQKIHAIILRDMFAQNIDDTPKNRLVALKNLRSDWINEESTSDEKDAWIDAINAEIALLERMHNL